MRFFFFSKLTHSGLLVSSLVSHQNIQLVRIPCFFEIASRFFCFDVPVSPSRCACFFFVGILMEFSGSHNAGFIFQEPMVSSGGLVTAGWFSFGSSAPCLTVTFLFYRPSHTVVPHLHVSRPACFSCFAFAGSTLLQGLCSLGRP